MDCRTWLVSSVKENHLLPIMLRRWGREEVFSCGYLANKTKVASCSQYEVAEWQEQALRESPSPPRVARVNSINRQQQAVVKHRLGSSCPVGRSIPDIRALPRKLEGGQKATGELLLSRSGQSNQNASGQVEAVGFTSTS